MRLTRNPFAPVVGEEPGCWGRASFEGRETSFGLVGVAGLEPATPSMSRKCSSQLSYTPSLIRAKEARKNKGQDTRFDRHGNRESINKPRFPYPSTRVSPMAMVTMSAMSRKEKGFCSRKVLRRANARLRVGCSAVNPLIRIIGAR